MNKYAGGEDVTKFYTIINTILKHEYGVIATTFSKNLTLDIIVKNIGNGINNGRPMTARAAYDGLLSGHFFVVCGYAKDMSNRYVTIMDPLGGQYRIMTTGGTQDNLIYKDSKSSRTYPVTIYHVMN